MRAMSLCTGIGGLDLAAMACGIEVVAMSEVDPFCRELLELRFPDTPNLGDMKEIVGDEPSLAEGIDILFGGIPCQPYSTAGRQLAENDPRDLWPAALRLVCLLRPTWVVIENVRNFVRLALERVYDDLEKAGYEVGAFVLPAVAIGAPHRRERVFLVAHAPGTRLQRQQREKPQRAGVRPANSGTGQVMSRMGREPDGLPDWLDRPFPVGRGEMQHAWEPARTVTGRPSERRSRLKALGNAVVPQQAYPIFHAVYCAAIGEEEG